MAWTLPAMKCGVFCAGDKGKLRDGDYNQDEALL